MYRTLIDSHCHLTYFSDEEQKSVIARALENRVSHLISISVSQEDFPKLFSLAEEYSHIFYTLGVHPDEAHHYTPENFEALVTPYLQEKTKCVALGETGLDYYRGDSYKKEQKILFEKHIELSLRYNYPLVVHTRDAEEDTYALLQQASQAVLHCFTGSKECARLMLDLGFYISFSGIVTFKNAQHLQKVVSYVPLDRILLETDAPYLAPEPQRGQRNEPSFLCYTAEKIAQIKNISLEILTDQTTRNACAFFSLPDYTESYITATCS